MPILEVHLVAGEHAAAQVAELLTRMSARYAEVLESPLERVRAYVTLHDPERWATGGVVGVEAPYFTAIVLEGRPAEQRRRLLGGVHRHHRRHPGRGPARRARPDHPGVAGRLGDRRRARQLGPRRGDRRPGGPLLTGGVRCGARTSDRPDAYAVFG